MYVFEFAGLMGPQQVLSCVYSQELQSCGDDRHSPGQRLPGNIRLLSMPI